MPTTLTKGQETHLGQRIAPGLATKRDDRPSKDEYFMSIARVVASRATCLRRKVGAVLVKDNYIISTGYNGAPPGLPHCTEAGCLLEERKSEASEPEEHCVRTVHAEENAILQSALHGVSTKGAILYTTDRPCDACSKNLISAGISRVVFGGEYPSRFSTEFMNAAGVDLVKFKTIKTD
jgi:dCMP deaminase